VCDLRGIEMNLARTIVDHDEIVSRAAHFREAHRISFIVAAAGRLVMSSEVETSLALTMRDSSTSLGMTKICA
jgi:hypothetical protein